ncbi:MAG: ATP-binding cassette domain-containing protein [Oscillospiraceae bacterium]|nr:ATP-binding cassette domain-containing protein [Oscillospiraceae bacterium]
MRKLLDMPFEELYAQFPYMDDFYKSIGVDAPDTAKHRSFSDWLEYQDPYDLKDKGLNSEEIEENFLLFYERMTNRETVDSSVQSVTILGGTDKDGNAENFELTLKRGDVVSVVGPTGSGKSRLLADIEWLAQADTPTHRRILINGEKPDTKWRYSLEGKLVAELSQNMNYVMDVSVGDFLEIHGKSRRVDNIAEKKELIIKAANALVGEEIYPDVPLTALSGGQSRALMIADTAHLSSSPIVLIDEIENAGIDRKKAISVLLDAEKIILLATHDPVLALSAERRIVMHNGAVSALIQTTEKEKEKLKELEEMNNLLIHYRDLLKQGQLVEE